MPDAPHERRRPLTPPPGLRRRASRTPAGGDGKAGGRPPRPRVARWIWPLVIAVLIANLVVANLAQRQPNRPRVSYNFFLQQVNAGNVQSITSSGLSVQGQFKTPAVDPRSGSTTKSDNFQVEVPSLGGGANANAGPATLLPLLLSKNVTVNAKPPDQPSPWWQQLLLSFGPTILFVALLFWLFRRAATAGGAGGLMGIGRSRAKRYESGAQPRVTFQDVAGIDEAEAELIEVVDFLKTPERYRRLGGQIPRGVLLSGPPGTGKTLLARAVAGEADVPFFSMSASEFVEMIVGVGASRVRDLFTQAKAAAPAIIFIDELDAVGRARGGAMSVTGNDEREQTLNQILTEMDGFSGSEGVIVLAATNRPEVLDPALLRAGRFDRRVTVNPPDRAGREAILRVHTRGVPLAAEADLGAIASGTPGMVGADLRNLVNEAAITAARRNHERVQRADFTDALEKIVLGTERRIIVSAAERERTAYHESGHALLGMLIPGADPVRKVSIVPRGRALGVTFQAPDTDRYGYGLQELRGRITGALGGRAAERIVYGEITTGAESDLEQATRIARMMVGRWGMSEAVGPVSVLPGPQDEPLLFPGAPGGASEHTRAAVDEEVRRIIDDCEREAMELLTANRHRLDALAHTLLERETLDEADAYAAAGIDRPLLPSPA